MNRELLDEEQLVCRLQQNLLPEHIAIIMDGNGRWAERRGLPRAAGHRAGTDALRRVVHQCAELNIPYLTAYAFSTENWKRPPQEVNQLMALLVEYLHRELSDMHGKGVRLRTLGCTAELPEDAQKALLDAMEKTRNNNKITVNLALNYGGRLELVQAMRKIAMQVQNGQIKPHEIGERTVADFLYTKGMPDPDLLIRPAGECRLSNFMLWQSAYTEFIMLSTLWPDFSRRHLLEALLEYQRRERRYGGLKV